MRYLLREVITKGAGTVEYRDEDGVADAITLGAAADQTITLQGDGVAAQHASIARRLGGEFQVKVTGPLGIKINAAPAESSTLKIGDSITLGTHKLTLIPAPTGFDIALSLERGSRATSTAASTETLAPAPSLRAWSWTLFLVSIIAGLLLPLAGFYQTELRAVLRAIPGVPSDAWWSSGPLAKAHQIDKIGNNCNTCHVKLFAHVPNSACKDCHGGITRHSTLDAATTRELDARRCSSCHYEHTEPGALVRRDQAFCAACHAQLAQLAQLKQLTAASTTLRDTTDFSDGHPEFRLTYLVSVQVDGRPQWQPLRAQSNPAAGDEAIKEASNLKFSHKVHLDPRGVRAPDGRQVMQCADCHRPDSTGVAMQQVSMKRDCEKCHALTFDLCNSDAKVPHAQADQVLLTVEGYYRLNGVQNCVPKARDLMGQVSLRIPGKSEETVVVPKDANAAIAEATRFLFEKSACHTCHEASKESAANGRVVYAVAPTRLNPSWMPKAYFTHKQHSAQKCTECHNAELSEKSSDVLMPNLKSCRECHGGENSRKKLASPCQDCHRFHIAGLPGWYSAAPPSPSPSGRGTEGEGASSSLPRSGPLTPTLSRREREYDTR